VNSFALSPEGRASIERAAGSRFADDGEAIEFAVRFLQNAPRLMARAFPVSLTAAQRDEIAQSIGRPIEDGADLVAFVASTASEVETLRSDAIGLRLALERKDEREQVESDEQYQRDFGRRFGMKARVA
jgi:hypothetical protein